MQALIDDCDFIGMSFYAPVTVSPTPDDFVRGIDRFMGEFKQYGLSVPTTKPMQFSEVGIGGRRCGGVKSPIRPKQSKRPGKAQPTRAIIPGAMNQCAHCVANTTPHCFSS